MTSQDGSKDLPIGDRGPDTPAYSGLSDRIRYAMGDGEVFSEEKEGQKENEPPEWFKFGAYLIVVLVMLVVVILLGKAVVWAWNL